MSGRLAPLFASLTHGIYVVGVSADGRKNAFTAAWFECELAGEIPSGDHVLVLGQVVNGGMLAEHASPMNYREVADAEAAKRLLPGSFQP